jgi:tetratricopeptide (TPR) repeat protein
MGEPTGTKRQVEPWVAIAVVAAAVAIFGGIWLTVGNRKLDHEFGPATKGTGRSHGNKLAMKVILAGNSYALAGMYDSALVCYREALRIAEQAGNTKRMAACYQNISNLFDYKNMPESVRFYTDAAIAMNRASAHPFRSVGGLIEQGTYMSHSLGNLDSGRILLEKGLAECRDRNDTGGQAIALFNLASLHATLGEYDSACVLYESCASICHARKNWSEEAGALHAIAQISLVHNRLDEAKSWLLKTVEVAHEGLVIGEEASALLDIALVRAEQGERGLAKANAQQALRLYQQAGDNGGMNACRNLLADLEDAERWQNRTRVLDSLLERRKAQHDQGI